MNISASNQSLENIIIRQEKEKKRPSFASVFEKINKRTSNMNRITPLNSKLTNEQLFRYYLKETDPKLRVSDDAFGEDETTLADLITNRSLNKSKVNQTLQTDDGDDDEGKDDDASARNVDEYLRIVEEINDEKQQDQSNAGTEASKQLENSIRPEDVVSLTEFMEKLDLEKAFNEVEKSPFNKKEATRRHGGDLLYEIAQNNAELGFVNDEFKDKINPMYEGSTDDFVSSIVGNITDGISRNAERLQNSLMEAGVDVREIASLSPIKTINNYLVRPKVVKKKKEMQFLPDDTSIEAIEHRNVMKDVMKRATAELAALEARNDVITKRGRGRPAGSTNKVVTPSNMETRSSKAKPPETEEFQNPDTQGLF